MGAPSRVSYFTWLFLFAWPTGAAAQWLTPPEPVDPDGFEVWSPQSIAATDASVVALDATHYRVVPKRGASLITLTSSNQHQSLRVGPPATKVAIALNPAKPVKNRDSSAELLITVDGDSAPPVVRTNVGRIEGLERVSPGHFRARYELPRTRYPEVAIIVAFTAWPHAQSTHGTVGVLRVPLSSAVDLPGKVEPHAQLTLTFGGQTFGPVQARADGAFVLPLVVPPGFGVAEGKTIDRVGNSRTTKIDLMLPPTDQLACVATPSRLPADGQSHARILCATSDRFGNLAHSSKVLLSASSGRLSAARELGNGILEWIWTSGVDRREGVARFNAVWPAAGPESKDSFAIELNQNPVSQLELADFEPVAAAGSPFALRVRPLDALGRIVTQPIVELVGSQGTKQATQTLDDGSLLIMWTPSGAPRFERLSIHAYGPLGTEPAKLLTWSEAGHLWAAVTDLSGLPVPGQKLRLGSGASFETRADGLVELSDAAELDAEVHLVDWPDLKAHLVVRQGALVYPLPMVPPRVIVSRDVTVVAALPVNVRVRQVADGEFEWWLERSDGTIADGRSVEVVADSVTTRVTSQGRQRIRARELSVVDVASGVGAATGSAR